MFDSPELGRQWMDGFLKKVEFVFIFFSQSIFQVSIVRKSYQGSHSLEGNRSSQFLKKIDQLEMDLLQ